MRNVDLLEETYTALSANKVRSGLTMLGIIIGISSVIAMVAIGNGASSSISASIASIGSNLLLVTPGAPKTTGGFGVNAARGGAHTLTASDASAILSQVSNVAAVSSVVTTREQVAATGENTNTSITGVDSSYAQIRNVTMNQGSFISDEQVSSYARVAVIGPTALTDLFGTDAMPSDVIGQNIRINGELYQIIGVPNSKGGSGFTNADDVIYIPYTTAQRYLTGNNYLTEIDISAASTQTSAQVETDTTNLLLQLHKISDPTKADFSILNQADIVATATSVTSTLTYLLAAVAGISLVVGGIGIMNMMLTNVTERTREIGLRKAIGAKSADISQQFLIESVALTVIGGGIGIALGWAIAFVVNITGIATTTVSISSVLLAFGVSAVIGIAFGWYPARRAANLHPIDALRYE